MAPDSATTRSGTHDPSAHAVCVGVVCIGIPVSPCPLGLCQNCIGSIRTCVKHDPSDGAQGWKVVGASMVRLQYSN